MFDAYFLIKWRPEDRKKIYLKDIQFLAQTLVNEAEYFSGEENFVKNLYNNICLTLLFKFVQVFEELNLEMNFKDS